MVKVDDGLAFLFPGQGSQNVGMLQNLAASHAEVEATFAEASRALGFDLWKLVAQGPESDLNRTENTQPALLAASVSIWRIWLRSSPVRPAWMAGHSLGEYSALVCAGALAFGDAVLLVRERGRQMQQAVPAGTGAMAAILGLEDAQVIELCASASRPEALVTPANFNAPGQVVVAGHLDAVQSLIALAKAQGAKRSVLLPVSVPSHCPLMKPAAAGLEAALRDLSLQPPVTPVLHNVDVLPHRGAQEIRDALTEQLHKPVRWSETVQAMAAGGASRFVECGPGKVLSGLQKRIAPETTIFALSDETSLNHALETMQ